jgi:GT2 family glycosyltransferase
VTPGTNGSEKLSIIILVHNNIDLTLRCLESLADAVGDREHELILLDNASTESVGPLREYSEKFREFKLIREEENLSFSIANNRLAKLSTGGRLLFLNNDVFLRRDCIDHLIEPFMEEGSIGATGGKLLFPGEKSVQHAGIGQMLWDHPSNYGVGADPSDSRVLSKCERFALTGALLCVDKEVFNKVDGFDERYVWGTEDIDLCLKIKAAGKKTVYCPESVAIHCESATLKMNPISKPENNCLLYRKKWDPMLVPMERRYVDTMKEQGINRVVVVGTGTAARGMAGILDENGITITAFTSTIVKEEGNTFLNRPVVPLDSLNKQTYDRLMVASQYFFEMESGIRDYDPLDEPIYPLLS